MNAANLLTILRIFLAPVFFTTLVSYREGAESVRLGALVIFAVASLTDALDGFLARTRGMRTELGRFLDPFADKLLLLSGFLGLLFVPDLANRPPLWVTVVIVFRDLIIIAGLFVIFLMTGKVEIRPNFLGKATTAVQMLTLGLILLGHDGARMFCYLTAVLCILSGAVYMTRGLRSLAS